MFIGVMRGLVTPGEIGRILEGVHVTQSAMFAELSQFDMRTEVTSLNVPVYFFLVVRFN